MAEFPGDVFVLEYPGYGGRPGAPSERAIKVAALEMFEAEHKRYETVVLCGQSLGAAVTEAIFTRFPAEIHLLVLVAPFLSITEMARDQFRWFPTRFLLRDTMELFTRWMEFPGRSVVVIAETDEIVPRRHSLRFIAAKSATRRIIEIPAVTHNTIDLDRELWEQIMEPTGE